MQRANHMNFVFFIKKKFCKRGRKGKKGKIHIKTILQMTAKMTRSTDEK